MKRISLIALFFLIGLSQVNSQTVGLLCHNEGTLDDGYVLFAPIGATTTYLIDKCGKLMKTWISAYKPGQSVYLLPDGTLFRTGNANNATFIAGGQGGIVEMIDWDGNVTWSYTVSDTAKCQHHDAKVLPNGNVLIIAWELKTKTEAIAQGRNPALVAATLWSEQVLEIQPVGSNGGIVIWEWHLWDHLAQDFDATKPNFTSIALNPQLLNLNYGASAAVADWVHLNSIDYNPTLDQIVLSAHNMSEIWIIDHSTTAAQASGHSGGNSGKGGDFLYRWGNPQVYNNGTSADKKFFGQHNAYWIESGVPFANQIMVFNNGVARPGGNYSTVEIINPPVNGYTYMSDVPFLPLSSSWIYNAGNPNAFNAQNISGAQQLSNGNVLMCNGPAGTFIEVTTNGTMVWKYINPVKGAGILPQGNVPTQNLVFRCSFYPKYYSGFSGHVLIPGSIIENYNIVSDECILSLGMNDNKHFDDIQTYPNPTSDYIIITGISGKTKIFNNSGTEMWSGLINNTRRIDISEYPSGLYYFLNNNTAYKFIVGK